MTLDVVAEILLVTWNRNYFLTDFSSASYLVGFSCRLAWVTWFKGRKKKKSMPDQAVWQNFIFICIAVTVRSSPSLGWSSQVLLVVCVTLSSLEGDWGDGRSNFLCLVEGERCNGFVTTKWCNLGRAPRSHVWNFSKSPARLCCPLTIACFPWVEFHTFQGNNLARPAKKLNQKTFFLLMVLPK